MTTSNDEHTPPPADPEPAPPRAEQLAPYDAFEKKVRAACRDAGTQQALRRGLGKPVDELPARTHAALLRKGLLPYGLRDGEKRAHYAVAALIAARPREEREEDRKNGDAPEAPAGADPAAGAGPAAGAEPAAEAEPAAGAERRPEVPMPDGSASGGPAEAARASKPSWGTSLGACLAQADDRTDLESDKIRGLEARLHLLVRQDDDGLHRMLPALLRQLASAGVRADYGRLLRDLILWPSHRAEVAGRWLEDYYRTLRRPRNSEAETPSA